MVVVLLFENIGAAPEHETCATAKSLNYAPHGSARDNRADRDSAAPAWRRCGPPGVGKYYTSTANVSDSASWPIEFR